MNQDWQRTNIAWAEQLLHHDSWYSVICVCVFIFVHDKQFSENKIKRPTEIKSKFSSSDSSSDPYLPSPKTTTVVSGLFAQKFITCIQMNVYKWKRTNTYFFPLLFSHDSIPCMPSRPPSLSVLLSHHLIYFLQSTLNLYMLAQWFT